jgi:hypothetical protein
MNKWLLPAAVAAITLAGGAAMAQPYGYYGGYGGPYYGGGYGYGGGPYYRGGYRDSDGDGVPDRAEWGRDRDHDGRPDQWDRYDNHRHWRWRHRYGGYWRPEYRPYGDYPYGYRW